MSSLIIKSSPGKGRGVFANQEFLPGDIIEVCPVIPLAGEYMGAIESTPLTNHYFIWGEDSSELAICLGYGSLYNHADVPNARIVKNYSDDSITFICERKVTNGEEIAHSYMENHPGREILFDSEGNRTY